MAITTTLFHEQIPERTIGGARREDEAGRAKPMTHGDADGYGSLKRRIAALGLLDKDPTSYLTQAVTLTSLLLVTGACFAIAPSPGLRLLCAVPAALLSAQLAFIGHDAAHLQVFRSSRNNYILGVLMFNLALGGSRGWWADRHNRHHANPNDATRDPDFSSPVFAYATGKTATVGRMAGFMVRHQATFVGPVLFLHSLKSRIATLHFLAVRNRRNTGLEASLVVIHYVVYIGAIVLVAGWKIGALFMVIHEGLFSVYLGVAFITNHIGMAVPEPGVKAGFVRTQVRTARNLRANRATDYLFGSLTCQIEHHLFPSMPRHRLRAAAAVVRAHCHEHGIDYHETTLLGALREVQQQIATSATPLRHARR